MDVFFGILATDYEEDLQKLEDKLIDGKHCK